MFVLTPLLAVLSILEFVCVCCAVGLLMGQTLCLTAAKNIFSDASAKILLVELLFTTFQKEINLKFVLTLKNAIRPISYSTVPSGVPADTQFT